MARPTASIDAQIAVLEAQLSSAQSALASVGSRGTTIAYAKVQDLTATLNRLYVQRARLDGSEPMFVKPAVIGLH